MLTIEHIQNNFDTSSFQRGKNYYHKGMILNFEVTENRSDMVSFTSFVAGSYQPRYEVNVDVNFFEDGDATINAYCDCPVEIDCKHAVAACFYYLEHHQIKTKIVKKEEHLSWLEQLTPSVIRSKEKADSQNKYRFPVYILDWSTKFGILKIWVMKSYYKKNGGMAKPTNLTLTAISNDSIDAVSPEDKSIAKLIDVMNYSNNEYGYSYYFDGGTQIIGEFGASLIKQLISTKRCFWNNVSNAPLTMQSEQALNLSWNSQSANKIQLEMSVNDGASLVLTEPPFYINTKKAIMGLIKDNNYTNKQLNLFNKAPVLNQQQANELSLEITSKDCAIELPLPSTTLKIEKRTEQCIPKLTLMGESADGSQATMHYMHLSFNYGEHTVSALPANKNISITTKDKITQIARDAEKEAESLSLILSHGFDYKHSANNAAEFYSPNSMGTKDNALRWQEFVLYEVPKLKQQGWIVEPQESYQLTFSEAEDFTLELEETENNWFDLHFDLQTEKGSVSMLPLITELLNEFSLDSLPPKVCLQIGESDYLSIDSKKLEPVMKTLYQLFDSVTANGKEPLKISKMDAAQLAEIEASNQQIQIKGAQKLLQLGRKLRDFKGIKAIAKPKGLQADLRNYQQAGLNWLQFLREYQLNGILADDMGLGKTIQTLAHLQIEKEQKRSQHPSLIIAPTSLMSNWRREAELFCPELKVHIFQGSSRYDGLDKLSNVDIVLSTYPLLPRDEKIFTQQKWHYLILDEAQMVKNAKSKAAKIIRHINCQHRLCLTGTPMENHIGELWALYDFLMPGFLGTDAAFKRLYRTPIEKHQDRAVEERLSKKISPFLLRRTKTEVATELPVKTEIIRTVSLGKEQSMLYESIRLSMEKKVRQAISKQGLARSHIMVLDALLKLRQVCCHPQLLKLEQAKKVITSAKLDLLMDMVPEMVEEGRKILLFSQFTSMLSLIETEFKKHKIKYSKLTGQTRKREQVIDEFKSGKSDVFLISLKAGGVGLNLTEADTVIIFDPWWNPAAENQAADRCYRIGQDKPVFVYKIIVENSLEEKIIAMQQKKQQLAEGMYGGKRAKQNPVLTGEMINNLLAPIG